MIRINSASCQCINNKVIATPMTIRIATRNLLNALPMKLSIVSISVTRCEATAPLPMVSYSAIEMVCSSCRKLVRNLKVISFAIRVNSRVCHTDNRVPMKRKIMVTIMTLIIVSMGPCQLAGNMTLMVFTMKPGLSSKTSSTSSGINMGTGTRMTAAKMAIR